MFSVLKKYCSITTKLQLKHALQFKTNVTHKCKQHRLLKRKRTLSTSTQFTQQNTLIK